MDDKQVYKLVYEDDKIVVVSKREGVLVSKGRGDLAKVKTLTDYLRERYKEIYRVHRIDKETSGLVLFARDVRIHRELSILFEKRKVEKEYLAVVWGRVDKKLVIEKPIREFSSGRCGVSEKGKEAITYIEPLKYFDNFTLVKAIPYTGRRHQIRVHLYSVGHSVVGDPLYGEREKQLSFPRMFLHSAYLAFILFGKRYSFEDRGDFLVKVSETFSF